jgi:hypothetical protein
MTAAGMHACYLQASAVTAKVHAAAGSSKQAGRQAATVQLQAASSRQQPCGQQGVLLMGMPQCSSQDATSFA